jgi:TATA-box binding protein (TBP) (component of TFIID and TFIIIB)
MSYCLDKENELLSKIEEQQKGAIVIESQIQSIIQTIERKTKQLNNIVYNISDLEKRITAFYSGWLTFIANLKNNTELKALSETVMAEFKNSGLKKSETQFQNQSN